MTYNSHLCHFAFYCIHGYDLGEHHWTRHTDFLCPNHSYWRDGWVVECNNNSVRILRLCELLRQPLTLPLLAWCQFPLLSYDGKLQAAGQIYGTFCTWDLEFRTRFQDLNTRLYWYNSSQDLWTTLWHGHTSVAHIHGSMSILAEMVRPHQWSGKECNNAGSGIVCIMGMDDPDYPPNLLQGAFDLPKLPWCRPCCRSVNPQGWSLRIPSQCTLQFFLGSFWASAWWQMQPNSLSQVPCLSFVPLVMVAVYWVS